MSIKHQKQDSIQSSMSGHQTTAPRRRAASNYQTLDEQVAERGRKTLVTTDRITDVPRSNSVFDILHAKFGFQEGNVRNQREHFDSWVLNYESRSSSTSSEDAVLQIHAKFFKNYLKWCTFLKTKPYTIDVHTRSVAEKQIALFLLIWGEAGNIRFMPECLCFLYHTMASKLESLERLPNVTEGSFLRRVVRPIYLIVARMRAVPAGGKKALDHKNITNYDDVNEFFWSSTCLDYDELNVADAINVQEHKTFKERRSFLNPLLAFFRIYFFLFVMFHVLTVIAYVAYRSDPELHTGLRFYANFFTPMIKDVRLHAFLSIFMTVSGLLALKVVLEVWIGGARIFTKATYATALFVRLCWHSVFFGLFAVINASPYEPFMGGDKDFLSMGIVWMIIYLVPVVIAALIQTCAGGQLVWGSAWLNGLDGTSEQFIGRSMGQSWSSFLSYGLFWSILYILKFAFNLQLMIKPLIGPSTEIFDIKVSTKAVENGLIESDHNIAFLVAMWSPVFLVYLYDSQIWLAIMQSMVGACIGIRLKIGHSSRIPEFVDRLKAAPKLFDDQVVSLQARNQLAVDSTHVSSRHSSAPDANSRLRFAVVWNEIVSSFRLSDLLDDRETAILQYQISDSGSVEDPVFLIAGQAQLATDIVARVRSRRLDDLRLQKELEKAGVLGCALNCVDIAFQILRQLLGSEDVGVIQVFEEIMRNGTVSSHLNLLHMPLVRENIVDLLACILDLPEPTATVGTGMDQSFYGIQHDQVMVIVQHVDALLRSIELMLEEEWMAEKMRQSVFAQMTADLSYQKQQLVSIFADRVSHRSSDEDGQHQRATASPSSNESVISLSTRLFFLLTLDATDALPRCHEARRRMSFFLNSLSMRIPSIQSIASMHSFSVITPYYSESVLYSVDELNGRVTSNPLFRKVEVKGRDLSILKYLITFHSDEWGNFLERVGATSIEEALAETPTQVRLWASMRGQTLARTVHGMMMYEDALKMLRWLEIGSDQSISHLDKIKQMDRIAGLKFSYVTSCQLYSQHMASGDSKAADIDLLMRKYPTWRVSYVDTIHSTTLSEPRYDCVLVKSDGDEIVEVYRYELPGNPLVGEGKPENQNIALPFTRGEYVQTIDMNQEHYFEEALKIPNFLATGTENGTNVTILGMKEHIFTGRASSLAHFMTLQELVFVSLTQRVLASPLRSRMHYGHPDVFEKSFVMTNGGVSKASRGINLSEDVFSGYNAALRGEHVTHVEFMQCGKGRDVTLSQINAFEAKLSNGSAESSLSREAHRMGSGMDFFRLHSMFYGHMGFYICNALTVLCVFVYAYAKLYIALHEEIQDAAIVITGGLDDLADVLNTQFIFQFGMLMTIPLMATLLVEYGWRQATANFVELLVTLGPIFYIFETGTKAHFYDVAIMRGGSKYRGTGRGFAIIRETLVNFYKEYAASHYRKAVELMCVMILFGVYGNFSIGTSALEDYCASLGITDRTACNAIDPPQNITLLESYGSKGQDYGVASFAVWVLGASFILAPFLFNTDGLDFAKTRVDIGHWLHWMMAIPGEDEESLPSSQRNGPSDTWLDFYYYESDLVKDMAWTGRVGYMIRELRHPLTMYYVYMTHFKLVDLGLLAGSVGGIALLLWAGSFAGGAVMRNKVHTVRSIAYIIIVIGSIIIVPIVYGSIQSWTVEASVSLVVALFLGLYTVLQYLLLFHGVFGVSVARWGLVVELAFLFDMVVGLFLIFPLLILSAFPFMRTIQTRMMYNVSFSKALSSGSEFAASLSVVVGGLGGWVYGWMNCLVYSLGYVNAPEDSFLNRSFIYFVNEKLDRTFELDTLSVFAALAAALGVIIGTVGAHVFGRRAAIVLSSLVCFGGGALVFVTSSTLILLGCCLVCMGTGMLSISCVLYNYEICMKGWKGKGVLMFLFGASLGYFVEAMVLESLNSKTIRLNWSNVPLHDWQIQFLLGLLPLVILIPVTFFFPETPFWLFRNRDHKSAESTLIRLRQKHDVLDEMDDLKHAFVNKGRKINLWFRVALVIVLQIGFALMMSNALLLRVKVKPSKEVDGEATSKWLIYFGGTNLTGVLLSLMTVDNIRRKTIFKDILPFTAAMSVTCGILDVAKVSNSGFMNVLLYLLFTSASLSLTCATWLTAIEVFPPYQNSRYVALVFVIYYLIQALIYYTKPTFALSHFIFAAICVVLTGVMFAFCASTKAGAIELKGEKKLRQKEEAALADDEEISSYVARVSRSQSFLRSRVRRSSSRYTARTPREGNYENFESPAAHGQTVRRTVNGSRHRQDA